MIRDPKGNALYWDEWTKYNDEEIQRMKIRIRGLSGDPAYRPQFIFELAKEHWHQVFSRYSRGDDIKELAQYFPPLLDA